MSTAITRDIKSVVTVRQVLNLVHWRVRSRGRADCGLCEGNSKGSVAFTEQLWKCHRCGAGGDVFRLIERVHNRDFSHALKFLAAEARVELPDRTKMSAQERQQLDRDRAKQKRQREEFDIACTQFDEEERALRRECRARIHFCDEVLLMPGEWTDEQWSFARLAHELRDEFLLPEYTVLSFAPVEERLSYVMAGELERIAMVSAVRWAGGVTTDGHFIEVIE